MSIGPFQILIVVLMILVLFGRGRISGFMGDFGKGVKNFRQGLGEDEKPATAPRRIEGAASGPAGESAAESHRSAD